MKQVYAYSLALALVLATFATPSMANGTGSATGFTVTMQDFPDVVSRGDEVSGTVTITVDEQTRSARRMVNYSFYITTPLGDALVDSGSFSMRTDVPRTISLSQPIDERAPIGLYQIKLVVTIGQYSASVGHDLKVQ